MARPCPKCNRPNNERAPRCIYCGTTLPPVTVGPGTAAKKEAAPAAGDKPAPQKAPPAEAYQVIISPRQRVTADCENKLARFFSIDRYTTRQKLKQPAPWTARVFPDAGSANQFYQALGDLGIDSYVVKQSGIDRISSRVQAVGLRAIEPEGVVFEDGRGNELRVGFTDAFLIVRGRIKEQPEREESPEEGTPVRLGKLAVGAVDEKAAKGPVRQAIERFSWRARPGLVRWVLRGHSIEIMDIYVRSSPRSVRVVETEFDYRGLGELMNPSGLKNFTTILNAFRDNAPGCGIDSTFNAVGYTMRETPKEDRVRSQLEGALGTSEGAKKIYDNRAHFDDFSARIYLHRLREASKSRG